jgi:hypothetical protein
VCRDPGIFRTVDTSARRPPAADQLAGLVTSYHGTIDSSLRSMRSWNTPTPSSTPQQGYNETCSPRCRACSSRRRWRRRQRSCRSQRRHTLPHIRRVHTPQYTRADTHSHAHTHTYTRTHVHTRRRGDTLACAPAITLHRGCDDNARHSDHLAVGVVTTPHLQHVHRAPPSYHTTAATPSCAQRHARGVKSTCPTTVPWCSPPHLRGSNRTRS